MSELAYISNLDPNTLSSVKYNDIDLSVINQQNIDTIFDPDTDYIEFFIYDFNKTLLYSTLDYRNYNIQTQIDSINGIAYNTINVDPSADAELFGVDRGKFFTKYNFFRKRLASNSNDVYYISEISSDRTEIRISSNTIQAIDTINSTNEFINYITNATYYPEFYFNNGNQLLTIINIALVDDNPLLPSVLLKLYEPLPSNFDIKSKGWIVEKVSEPVAYGVEYPLVPVTSSIVGVSLGGPNFNITLQDQIGNSTIYQSYNSIINSPLTASNSQIDSFFQEKSIDINVDYSDYSNFVNFSSAVYRLENFYYKLTQIQSASLQLSASVNIITGSTSASFAVSQSRINLQNYVNDLITNFDEYEYYLYYTSGSKSWPKTNSTPPYTQAGTGSVDGLAFLSSQTVTASNYDLQNPNNLFYAIPEYLRSDPDNAPFEEFVGMIGNHFDNLWVYYKDVSSKYNADNRIDYGISKDLVADVLKDFGLKIYQNSFSSDDVYLAFLGLTSSGSTFPVANITSSLPVPGGSFIEYISSSISASDSIIPLNDLNKRIYKRLYHNLPYLLKKKGTEAGLRTLINTYGIPDTILRINEFGGKNRNENQDWDNWQDTFNYALSTNTYGELVFGLAPWRDLTTTNKTPQTIEFRFKTTEFPPTYYTSSLAVFVSSSNGEYLSQGFILEYTGSGLASSSYSGSTYDPYYQYATLKYVSQSISTSVYLPFYNGDWWSVGLTLQSASNGYTASLYAKQKGTFIGDSYIKYKGSSSVILKNVPSASSFLYIPGNANLITPFTYGGGKQATPIYSASFQELRYYSVPLSESVFDDFVMNPYSIEGNTIQGASSAYNTLLYRINLGSDLNQYYPTISSSHQSVTGSTPTQSFSGNIAGTYIIQYNRLDNSPIYNENKEFIYQDQPNAGIKIQTTNKIQLAPSSSYGQVLSKYRTIQQDYPISQSYTEDVNYVEVGFSPQDEINDDIQDQFGFFNIGDYIGDPRQISSSNTFYPDLNTLRDNYFQKYYQNNNIWDYIRLIKYFDNSLFKLIQDFIPARAGLATGVIIKPHILERSKYPVPQFSLTSSLSNVGSGSTNIVYNFTDVTITGSIGNIITLDTASGLNFITHSGDYQSNPLYTFTGSNGGIMPDLYGVTASSGYFINITQSYQGVNDTIAGLVSYTQSSQQEFYNGELSGSILIVTTQSLNPDCAIYLDANDVPTPYVFSFYTSQVTGFNSFNDERTTNNGEIYLFYDTGSTLGGDSIGPGGLPPID